MSATSAVRTLRLRQPPTLFLSRQPLRHASSTTEKASEAATKTKEAATSIQSKASEGLTRVSSSAGPAISGAARAVSNALGRIGGRTGRLIGMVESAIPPTIYYSKVGLELAKLVFQGRKMAPPSLQTFQSYLNPVLHAARNPTSFFSSLSSSATATAEAAAASPQALLSRVRGVDRAQLATAGVVLAELLGFFTIGEMLGRMKIVGYRGEVHHDH